MAHTAAAIQSALEAEGLTWREVHPGVYAAPFDKPGLRALCENHLAAMEPLETADTKSLVLCEDETLDIRHLTRMEPLTVIVARLRGERLVRLMDESRICVHFQPIVRADDPSSVFAHECLARGMDDDGRLIMPDELFRVARDADLLFNLDRVCRLSAIRCTAEHGVETPIFLNFNPTTIYNPEYCLKSTLEAIRKVGMPPYSVVFEVVESDEVRDVDHLRGIVEYYRKHGMRVALDDLGAGYGSLNLLEILRPDFVKLDMNLVHGVDSNPYKAAITRNLLAMARELGVRTIAEGVETVAEWDWLTAHGADLLQGYLFARPAAPPQPVRLPAR